VLEISFDCSIILEKYLEVVEIHSSILLLAFIIKDLLEFVLEELFDELLFTFAITSFEISH